MEFFNKNVLDSKKKKKLSFNSIITGLMSHSHFKKIKKKIKK